MAAKKTEETAETTTETTKVTIPSVDQLVKDFADTPVEELNNTIKAAKQARWDRMDNWQKAGHVAVQAAPYVLTAAAAGAGGYYLAGGFNADAGVDGLEADNVIAMNG
jgi:hypothetical protein